MPNGHGHSNSVLQYDWLTHTTINMRGNSNKRCQYNRVSAIVNARGNSMQQGAQLSTINQTLWTIGKKTTINHIVPWSPMVTTCQWMEGWIKQSNNQESKSMAKGAPQSKGNGNDPWSPFLDWMDGIQVRVGHSFCCFWSKVDFMRLFNGWIEWWIQNRTIDGASSTLPKKGGTHGVLWCPWLQNLFPSQLPWVCP